MSLYINRNNSFCAEYLDGGPILCDYLQIVCHVNVRYKYRLMLPLLIYTAYNVEIHYDYANKKAVVWR
nr:MAG TPA: hypothetical protein [Caudoviricetes sp.]